MARNLKPHFREIGPSTIQAVRRDRKTIHCRLTRPADNGILKNEEVIYMLGSFGTTELIIILVIVMVLFGAKKLPELAKGLGQGINEFKKAQKKEPAEENQNTSGTSASKDA